jgi:hypothetical protein
MAFPRLLLMHIHQQDMHLWDHVLPLWPPHNTLHILEIKVKRLHSHNTLCSTHLFYLVDCPHVIKPIDQILRFIKMTVLIWILLLVDSSDIKIVSRSLCYKCIRIMFSYWSVLRLLITGLWHSTGVPLTSTTVHITNNIDTLCPEIHMYVNELGDLMLGTDNVKFISVCLKQIEWMGTKRLFLRF